MSSVTFENTVSAEASTVRIAVSESSGFAASSHSSLSTSSEAPNSSIVSCRYKMSFARERRSRRSWINSFCAMKRVGCAIRICFGLSKGNPKYLELLTRIRERDFENFVYEVVISIQFVQGLFEHFQLKIKIHPYRTIEAYQPGVDRNIGVLPFGTKCIAGTAKITLFLVTNVQSPSMMRLFNSQSFHPRFPIQAT